MAIEIYRQQEDQKTSFEIMPLAFQLADKLSATEFVPVALRNRPAAIAAAILTGHEIGLPPMASLAHIHVIQGRPTLSAAAMRGLVLAHGHRIWIEESTNTRATVCSQRRGEERVSSTTWTIDDAERAKLKHKDNWITYPRAMLIARATGDNARANFMDVLAGIAYTSEEAEDMDPEAPPAGGQAALPAAPAGTVRRRARRAATAAAPSEPPPAPEPAAQEQQPRTGDDPPPAPAVEPVPGPSAEEGGSVKSKEQAPESPPSSAPAAALSTSMDVGTMTLAQQVAMVCREHNIDRAALIDAVTGKERARDLTRMEATDVLDKAKAIGRGEARLELQENRWVLLPVEKRNPLTEDPGRAFRNQPPP